MVGEAKRKLMHDLVKLFENKESQYRILMAFSKTQDQDIMFKNFEKHFNSVKFDRLSQCQPSYSYNDCMENCQGKHFVFIV